jgi:hypothetical protein
VFDSPPGHQSFKSISSGDSSIGRVPDFQSGRCRFEADSPLHYKDEDMSDKKSFIDMIKEAQAKKVKDSVPDAKGQDIAKVNLGKTPIVKKTVRKSTARGR